jgi:hypothetical protein
MQERARLCDPNDPFNSLKPQECTIVCALCTNNCAEAGLPRNDARCPSCLEETGTRSTSLHIVVK